MPKASKTPLPNGEPEGVVAEKSQVSGTATRGDPLADGISKSADTLLCQAIEVRGLSSLQLRLRVSG